MHLFFGASCLHTPPRANGLIVANTFTTSSQVYAERVSTPTSLHLKAAIGKLQKARSRGWAPLLRVTASSWYLETYRLKPPLDLRVIGSLGEQLVIRC